MLAFVKAELALRAKPLIEAQAKARQQGGQGGVLLMQNSAEAMRTRDELARRAGVSHDTIDKVQRIKENAPDVLVQAVRNGDVSIHQAAQALGESAAI